MRGSGVQVQLVEVCSAAGVPIIADEVYQQNVWADDKAFVSFRKVALDHPQPAGTVVRSHRLHLAVRYVRMLRMSSRAGHRRCMRGCPWPVSAFSCLLHVHARH